MELPDFLLARIADDEEDAQAAIRWMKELGSYTQQLGGHDWTWQEWARPAVSAAIEGTSPAHLARWDPARVLAECEAKRLIVVISQQWLGGSQDYQRGVQVALDSAMRLLATPYADHADYREEWKP